MVPVPALQRQGAPYTPCGAHQGEGDLTHHLVVAILSPANMVYITCE